MCLLVKNNWFLIAFVLVLAVIGIRLEQSLAPNQEILIQFSNTDVGQNHKQDAIALVTTELAALDIDDLRVEQLTNGTFKVSYYSSVDVIKIKEILSQAAAVVHQKEATPIDQDAPLPFENDIASYQIDIYKIQDGSDLGGTSSDLLESKSETTRSTSYKTYASIYKLQIEQKNKKDVTTYKRYSNARTALLNASYIIPESRAGPYS